MALSARNLALAEEQGFDAVVTACAACFNMLYKAWDNFANNPGMRKQLEEAMSDDQSHSEGESGGPASA